MRSSRGPSWPQRCSGRAGRPWDDPYVTPARDSHRPARKPSSGLELTRRFDKSIGYEVLPAGREELARWTATPQDPKPPRDALLLRLRASAMVGTAGIEADLRRHLTLRQRQLAECESIQERDFGPDRTSPQDRLQHLILRAGIDLETFWTQWLTHALEEFEQLPAHGERA